MCVSSENTHLSCFLLFTLQCITTQLNFSPLYRILLKTVTQNQSVCVLSKVCPQQSVSTANTHLSSHFSCFLLLVSCALYCTVIVLQLKGFLLFFTVLLYSFLLGCAAQNYLLSLKCICVALTLTHIKHWYGNWSLR